MSVAVNNLSFSYQNHPVLADVSFSVGQGELLAILGPNGVGKSTLFRCMLNLLYGYQGSILIDGRDARTLTAMQLANLVAYIPQSHHPAFEYTVLDMVLMGTAHQFSPFSVPGKKEKYQAALALDQVGMLELSKKNYARLSGGEQQLVLIARALAQQTKVLLMDEPTSNLDFGNQLRIMQRIRRLAADGYTVLLSSHNPQHALQFADTALALYKGRVAACGKPEHTITSALMKSLYGVEVNMMKTDAGYVILPTVEG